MTRLLLTFLAVSLFVFSCSTTQELEKEEIDELLDQAAKEMLYEEAESLELESSMELDFDLTDYRNRLSDNYAMLQNTVPESFRNVRAPEERRRSNHGFRVQILSTPDIQKADSVQREFIMWIDTLEVDYLPEAYVTFRQPNYRVHVGDFHDRSDAILFSQFVRQKYPHAWVVHDRINPASSPMMQHSEENGNGDLIPEPEEPEFRTLPANDRDNDRAEENQQQR